MASTAFTAAGTTFSVSAASPATFDAAGFGALTYTTIGEITDGGSYGRTYNPVTHNPIDERKTYTRKGSYTDGSMTLQMAVAAAGGDAGQGILKTALNSDDAVSVKVVFPDGEIDYFTALVMSAPITVGGVDTILSMSIELTLDSDVITV